MSPHKRPTSARNFSQTQMLLEGLYSSGLCVLYQDASLVVRLVENPPASWPAAETILEGGDVAIFDRVTAERVLAVKRNVLKTGVAARIEVANRRDGADPDWFDLNIVPDPDAAGAVRGLFVSVTEITQFKRREAELRALHYEVSHRSRNLLAILQSILRHTVQHSDSTAEFERKFRGRIESFAQSQDLLTWNNWHGVRLRQLVQSQVAQYLRDGGPDPEFLGADPMVGPNSALHIGLALHELAANSAAFGVLASGEGSIAVSVETDDRDMRLAWIEELPQADAAPARRGFGQAILEQVVTRAVDGEASYAITPKRVSYQIAWAEPASA